jgi:hypothetical protein
MPRQLGQDIMLIALAAVMLQAPAACGEPTDPPQSAVVSMQGVAVGSSQVNLAVDKDSGEITITNWTDLVRPTLRSTLVQASNSKPDDTVPKYCADIAALFDKAKIQGGSSIIQKSAGQSIRKLSRVKVEFGLLPREIANPSFTTKVAELLEKQGSGLAQGVSPSLENPLSISRIQTFLDWSDDSLSKSVGPEGIDANVSKILNSGTDKLSNAESIPLEPLGDDISCDLATGRLKLAVEVEGRFPDKETRTTYLSARDSSRLVAVLEQNLIDSGQSDQYAMIRRSAVLADAYFKTKREPLSDLGVEKFVTLYRMIFEPDNVTGFTAAVKRYGKSRAISRGLDNVTTAPRIVKFEQRQAVIVGGAQ